MEAEADRFLRKSIPELAPRFATLTVAAYALNAIQARLRPDFVTLIPKGSLRDLCVMAATIAVITGTLVGLGGLVACYFYHLKDRRHRTALSEGGLAVRASLAGLLALGMLVFALMINDGTVSW